jgi:ribosomal protein L37AE/L43A
MGSIPPKKKKASPKKDRMCHKCRTRKPLKDMEDMGVWICKECLNSKSKK